MWTAANSGVKENLILLDSVISINLPSPAGPSTKSPHLPKVTFINVRPARRLNFELARPDVDRADHPRPDEHALAHFHRPAKSVSALLNTHTTDRVRDDEP